MENFGSRLKRERVKLKLTQAAFAKVGGVAANAQVHYECGRRLPRADYLERISSLGVDIKYVVGGHNSAGTADQGAASSVRQFGSHLAQNVDEQLDQLGEILWMTASTIAAVATMANPSDRVRQQMTENLQDFQSESQRFIALACDLGHS